MKLFSNHILIRLTKKTDELQLPGIGTLQIETVFDEERHQRLVGEVVQNPEELIFKNMDHSGMPWETEIETMVGDEVIMRRTDVSVARHEGRSFEVDGHLHVYIEYHSLILAKRKVSVMPQIGSEGDVAIEWAKQYQASVTKELSYTQDDSQMYFKTPQFVEIDGERFEVIMLNGFMLVEQDDSLLSETLSLPDEFKGKKAETGRIAFIGKGNKAYHDNYNSVGQKVTGDLPDSRFDLKVGDRVGFLKYSSIDLEFEMHQSFAGKGKNFVRMQRNKILCKLD